MAGASTTSAANLPTGRGFFWAGIGLCLLGFVAPVIQYSLKFMLVPWYMPTLTMLAAALLVMSLFRRRTVVRIMTLVLIVVLAGLEWYFLVVLARLPDYQGPARAGQTIPEFHTTLADGRSFTNRDLARGTPHVLVFFRGRW